MLVGLILVAVAIPLVLELFNPRPTITVSSPAVALGDELTVNWSIVGRVAKFTRFTVELQGTEEATPRRGTTTVTDRQVFARLPVTTKSAHELERTGFARVTIPADTMHSFEATHNKVTWVVRVRGEIPKWPDSDDEFAIALSPRR